MTFSLEQSADIKAVKHVLSAPVVFAAMSDDYTTPVAEWPELRSDVISFIARIVGEPTGIWLFVPENAICWRAHFAVLPVMYGDAALNTSMEVIAAVWHLGCLRIIGEIPAYNRLSLKFVRKLGFTKCGINYQSCMKRGALWDQIMVGLSKPGVSKWVS